MADGILSTGFLGYWVLGALAAFVFVWPLVKKICGTAKGDDVQKIIWSAGLGFLIGYTMYKAFTRDLTKTVS